MWILKNSKELVENLKSKKFTTTNSNKTYVFSTLYTTNPTINQSPGLKKNGSRKFFYLVISHLQNYFAKNHLNRSQQYSQVDMKKMLEFLIDNIYVVLWKLDLPKICWNSHGYQLRPSVSRPIFVFI